MSAPIPISARSEQLDSASEANTHLILQPPPTSTTQIMADSVPSGTPAGLRTPGLATRGQQTPSVQGLRRLAAGHSGQLRKLLIANRGEIAIRWARQIERSWDRLDLAAESPVPPTNWRCRQVVHCPDPKIAVADVHADRQHLLICKSNAGFRFTSPLPRLQEDRFSAHRGKTDQR
jgi:hypothetical protein